MSPINDLYDELPVMDEYRQWLRNKTMILDNIDTAKSKSVSRYCKIKQCYANAARNSFGGLKYYEGFVKTRLISIWIDHAFLVNENDLSVVDPTLAITTSESELAQCKYIGMRFDNPMVKMAKTKKFSPLLIGEFIKERRN